jgi:1-acyl-sn-glycerol-3-phosphate acyltransferase
MPTDPIPAEAVLEVVRALYVELHHGEPEAGSLVLSSRLETDLGLDSLARVELLLRLEQRFQLHLAEPTLASSQSVADLLRAVNAARASHIEAAPITSGDALGPAIPQTPEGPRPIGAPTAASTLQEVLRWRTEHEPEATHLVLLDQTPPLPLSYRTLSDQAESVARGLQRQGVGPSSTIALMLPTGLDFFFAFFGVLLTGAIPVPIYPPARASQLEEHLRRHALILTNAEVELLITSPEAAAVARLLRVRVPSLRRVLSVTDLTAGEIAATALPAPKSESIAMLQYTSGSTGSPKGVTLTHRNLLADIRAIGRQINATEADVFVSWLPLYHDMGLIGAWLGSLYFGCRLVIMPPTAFLTRPGRWLRAIHDYRGTLSAAPNFGYELAARRIPDSDLKGLNLSSWRIAFNGAEPVLPETIERFQARFSSYGFRPQAMTPVYGLAEAAVGLTCPPRDRGPLVDCVDRVQFMRTGRAVPVPADEPSALRFVSSGLPLPGYQVRMVDASGSELPERIEGSLQFAGPSATDGYYRNAAATERLKLGIWRDSGDRAYVANAEVFITGRSKDIIIRRGQHIYPEEIEQVLGELPGVRKGCVAAFGSIEPATATEKLIIATETYALDPQQRAKLIASINEQVVGCIGEPPEEIVLAPAHSVLKTSSGKLRRAATRAAYEDGSLRRGPASPARQRWRLVLESAVPLVHWVTRSAARTAYGLYAWSIFLAIAVPVICLTALRPNVKRAWRLTHNATSLLIRAWHIPCSVQWEAPIDLSVPHVIVANHCSYVDSLCIAALLPTAHCFISRFEWQDLPVLHTYFRKLGTIFIERSGPRDGLAELRQLNDALAQGYSLVVFPEGTFTRAPGVQAFHLGAFEAAVAAKVPIVPVALRGTRSLLRDGEYFPRKVPIGIVVGKPLRAPSDTDTFAAAVQLRDEARAHMLRHSGEPDLM